MKYIPWSHEQPFGKHTRRCSLAILSESRHFFKMQLYGFMLWKWSLHSRSPSQRPRSLQSGWATRVSWLQQLCCHAKNPWALSAEESWLVTFPSSFGLNTKAKKISLFNVLIFLKMLSFLFESQMTQHTHSSLGFPFPINCNNCACTALDTHLKTQYLGCSCVICAHLRSLLLGFGWGESVCVCVFSFQVS